MILADKITEERKRNGWSQEELASQLGVSRQAVSKWESAGSVPDLQRILQLAQLFGVTTDYLLKDEMAPEIISESTVYEENAKPGRKVSMEEANEFLDMKRKGAVTVANAVTMCILSPALLVILGSMADDHVFHVSDALASALGCIYLYYSYLSVTCQGDFTVPTAYSSFEKNIFITPYMAANKTPATGHRIQVISQRLVQKLQPR